MGFIGVYQYWLISNKPYRSYPDPGFGYTFDPFLTMVCEILVPLK